MMSESLITKETSLPDLDLKIFCWKIRVGPYATNFTRLIPLWEVRQVLILADLVEVDNLKMSGSTNSGVFKWQCDLKKKECQSSDHLSIITIFLHWLGNRIFFQIFNQWSQITFLLSIRPTGSQQIVFKVLKPFGVKYS